jgi:hypothetical protein
MTDAYTGVGSVPNTTPDQAASIEALLNLAPAARHDGLRREIAKALGDSAPFTDGAVMAAAQATLTENSGVPIPKALFAGATPAASTKAPAHRKHEHTARASAVRTQTRYHRRCFHAGRRGCWDGAGPRPVPVTWEQL